MTRPTRDGKRQRRTRTRLRLPAERRLFANPGGAARADARRGSMGAAQRYSRAGAEVSAVHCRVSCDRRRPERVAQHSHATANGAGVAVLERADAAGGALVDSMHPSDTHRAQARRLVRRLQRDDQCSRVCAPHLASHCANFIARSIGQVYSPAWSKAISQPPANRFPSYGPFPLFADNPRNSTAASSCWREGNLC